MILKIFHDTGKETFYGGITGLTVEREWAKLGSTGSDSDRKIYPEAIRLSFFDDKGEYKDISFPAFSKKEYCGFPETENSPLKTSIYLMNNNGKTVEKIF